MLVRAHHLSKREGILMKSLRVLAKESRPAITTTLAALASIHAIHAHLLEYFLNYLVLLLILLGSLIASRVTNDMLWLTHNFIFQSRELWLILQPFSTITEIKELALLGLEDFMHLIDPLVLVFTRLLEPGFTIIGKLKNTHPLDDIWRDLFLKLLQHTGRQVIHNDMGSQQ